MTKNIKFIVPGKPVAKGRPKFSNFGGFVKTYTPKDTFDFEQLVKLYYTNKYGNDMFDKDVMLSIDVYSSFPIPKSASKKKSALMEQGLIRPISRPDCDNCCKSVLDGLNAVAMRDDSQIVELHSHKFYSVEPKTIVLIRELDEDTLKVQKMMYDVLVRECELDG